MPVVKIDLYEGRSIEQKQAIIDGVKDVLVKQGVKKEHIIIILNENPKENFYFP